MPYAITGAAEALPYHRVATFKMTLSESFGRMLYLCFCKLGGFFSTDTMAIKNPKKDLPRNASKVFLDIYCVLVSLIKGLWVVSSLSHKGVSNANPIQLYCLCCPIFKPRPVVLAGNWASGRNVMG